MKKKDKPISGEIAIHCGTPMVQTFMFSRAEFYCTICGTTQGIFSIVYALATAELLQERQRNKKSFAKVASACIPTGCYLPNCKKCGEGEEHSMHAPYSELVKSDLAYISLNGGIANA